MKRWTLTTRVSFGLMDRVRLLLGLPVVVRFESPDGECHAAYGISARVQLDWPSDDERWT